MTFLSAVFATIIKLSLLRYISISYFIHSKSKLFEGVKSVSIICTSCFRICFRLQYTFHFPPVHVLYFIICKSCRQTDAYIAFITVFQFLCKIYCSTNILSRFKQAHSRLYHQRKGFKITHSFTKCP